jgi:hypothetical protein
MQTIDWWHDPILAFDKTIPEKFKAISIGWIQNENYTKGIMSDNDIKLLEELCNHCKIDQGWLGYHTCAICNNFEDRGEVLLRTEDDRYYVMPHMILHYVKDHQYKPSDQFIKDLRKYKIPKLKMA